LQIRYFVCYGDLVEYRKAFIHVMCSLLLER
jgi:hypothetical protein